MRRLEWVASAGLAILLLTVAGVFVLASKDSITSGGLLSGACVIVAIEGGLSSYSRRSLSSSRLALPPIVAATLVGVSLGVAAYVQASALTGRIFAVVVICLLAVALTMAVFHAAKRDAGPPAKQG